MLSRIFKAAKYKSNNVMFTINAAYANSAANPKAKVCIVGSGPAGFYTAQHLIKVPQHLKNYLNEFINFVNIKLVLISIYLCPN